MADIPPEDMTHTDMLRESLGHLRYLRKLLAEFEPLLSALRGNGTGDAVRLAGLRKAVRKGAGNAATPAQH